MKRSYKHLSPRYIKNRIMVLWDQCQHPKNPWLTADSVKLLEQLLQPSDVGVEFGSGRSTIWFVNRVKQLTSIENNSVWYESIKKKADTLNFSSKLDYRFCENLDDYVNQANSFSEVSIDFCLVDGEVRDSCALLMLPKIKSGGLMIVDNVNWYLPQEKFHSPNTLRPHDGCASDVWKEFNHITSSWRKIWTSNGVTDTCIWFKP
jgi:predicted O-methyltransferase YrrM